MSKKLLFWAVITASLLAVLKPAMAEDARDFHKKGVQLFKDERYEEAAKAFREAHRLRPTWKLLYNIGQCEAAGKRYGMALEAFEAYLVEGGDEVPDDRREYVSGEIRRIQPLVGVLDVEAESGAEVFVDGEPRAKTPLAGPLRVASGSHKVVLKMDGDSVYETTVNVAGGMTTKVTMDPEVPKQSEEPSEEPASSDPEPASIDTKEKPALKKTGWIIAGTGAAVVIGGAVTGIMALSKNNELEKNCPEQENCPQQYEDLRKSADSLALVTDILLGVGGAAVVTGVVLLLVSRKKEKEDGSVSSVSLAPTVGPGSMGLSIGGRF